MTNTMAPNHSSGNHHANTGVKIAATNPALTRLTTSAIGSCRKMLAICSAQTASATPFPADLAASPRGADFKGGLPLPKLPSDVVATHDVT
jgi:hypothetical protein